MSARLLAEMDEPMGNIETAFKKARNFIWSAIKTVFKNATMFAVFVIRWSTVAIIFNVVGWVL